MSGPERSEPESGVPVPVEAEKAVKAARALAVVQSLIARSDGRQDYNANPQQAFDAELREREELKPLVAEKARYEDIPEASRRALEALTIQQLALLSQLDQTFVEDGLYVDVPPYGRLHYK